MKKAILLIAGILISMLYVSAQNDSLIHYYNSGNYNQVISNANELTSIKKATYNTYYYCGLSQQALYKYSDAVESYLAAKKINANVNINLLLGKAYELAGSNDKAIIIYSELIYSDSMNVLAKARKAAILKSRKEYLEASELYANLIKQDSMNSYFYSQLAYCTSKLGLSDHAAEYYFTAYKLNTDDFKSVKGYLSELVKSKYYELANSYIDSFLYAFPDHIYLLKQKAFLAAIGGNYLDAVSGFKKVIERGDSTVFTCKYYGQSLYNNGNYHEAVFWLNRYLKSHPDDAKNHFIIGLAYQKDYQYQNSLDHFKIVEDIVYNTKTIAEVYLERGHTLVAYGDYYSFRDSTGRKKIEYYDLALESFLVAVDANPKNSSVLKELGVFYENKMHDPQLALYYYQNYYNQIDPDKLNVWKLQWIQDKLGELKEEVHFMGN